MEVKQPQPRRADTDATASSERPGSHLDAPAAAARLVVVYPRGLAGAHALVDRMTFGRGPEGPATCRLDHPTVSRRHLEVRWDEVAGRHCIVDLGSRNGTCLEGQPVAASLPRFLADGSVLRIGDVMAVYEAGEAPAGPEASWEALPGVSLAAQRLRVAIARAAVHSAPALVLGETGVGKERVAGELHRLSGREGPLVAVNCAALSPQLIESQLFGHARGAFTGAAQEQAGLFRAANGGSLFLDELGEMPLEMQPKLLRAVELGEIVAVGTAQARRVDVRLIAATNRSLTEEVTARRFRRDLYARLAHWIIEVPPLRSRRADIVGWIDRLHQAGWESQATWTPFELAVGAVEALLLAPWHDNLRGVQRLVHGWSSAGPRRIEREMLPGWLSEETPSKIGEPPNPSTPRSQFRPRPSREELVAALVANKWSLRATARHFDRDRKQIVRWVEMYTIEIPGRATSG